MLWIGLLLYCINTVSLHADPMDPSVGCATKFSSWSGAGGPLCRSPLTPVPWSALQKNAVIAAALANVTLACQTVIKQIRGLPLNLTSALSVVLVYGQDTIYNEGFGAVSLDKPSQIPDGNTIYNVGSITKVFTSLLALEAQAQGKLSMDDRLDKFYNTNTPPVWGVRNPYSSNDKDKAPSLRSLAGQVSGLPREPPCGVYNPAVCTEDVILKALADYYALIAPPFSLPHYSNLGFALLGRAVERVLNGTFEDLLPNLLASMDMNSSGFHYTPDVQGRMATGYHVGVVGEPQTESCCNTLELGWPAPAGGMYSSPNDIAAFFKQLFTGFSPLYRPQNSMLSKKSRVRARKIQHTRASVLSAELIADFFRGGYTNTDGVTGFGAAGWETFYSGGWPVFTKGGLIDGFAGSINVIPTLQLGVGVFLNFNSGVVVDDVAAYITNTLSAALNASLSALQSVPPLPRSDRVKLLLGSYGVSGTTYVTIALQPDNSLTGYLASYGNVTFTWDPIQDNLEGAIVALRFRLVEPYSCTTAQSLADQGLVYIVTESQPTAVIVPDLKIFGMPKI